MQPQTVRYCLGLENRPEEIRPGPLDVRHREVNRVMLLALGNRRARRKHHDVVHLAPAVSSSASSQIHSSMGSSCAGTAGLAGSASTMRVPVTTLRQTASRSV